MGEAKRRGAKQPTSYEKSRRWWLRVWHLYPHWFRTFYVYNLRLMAYAAGLMLLVVISFLVVQLFIRR
jgi:hypothetical protein